MQKKINEYFEKLCKDKFFKNDDRIIIGKVKDVIENLQQQAEYTKNPKNNIGEDDIKFIISEVKELIKKIKDIYSDENDVIYLLSCPMSGFYILQDNESLLEELEDYYKEMEENQNED